MRDLHKGTSAEFFGTNGKSTALIIGEAESAVTDLFAQSAVLLGQILDGAVLMFIEPTREAYDEERKWIEERGHGWSLPSGSDLRCPTLSTPLSFWTARGSGILQGHHLQRKYIKPSVKFNANHLRSSNV
jgi:hypothetical protein